MRNRTRNLFAAICPLMLVAGAVCAGAENAAQPPKFDLRELKMLDVQGERHDLVADESRGTVLVFLSSECPISRQYVPELNRLAKTAAERKLAFYGIVSDAGVTRADARKFVDEFHVAFPVLFDGSRELGVLFGPDHVPQAFLVDSRGSLQYRGRIDDLYADIDKRRTEPSQRDLLAAIVAVADGQTGRHAANRGDRLPVRVAESGIGVVQSHLCPRHRTDSVCALCRMSPAGRGRSLLAPDLSRGGQAGEGPGPRHRATVDASLAGRRALRRFSRRASADGAADRIGQSVGRRGAPEGNAADLPPQPKFPEGWRLGTPDLVVSVPVRYTVPADGPDIFQHFVMPLNLPKDQTVVAFEFRPGNPAVVHHSIVAIDTRGGARLRDAQTPEPGWRTSGSIDASITGILGVWTPGMTPRFYPQTSAWRSTKEPTWWCSCICIRRARSRRTSRRSHSTSPRSP